MKADMLNLSLEEDEDGVFKFPLIPLPRWKRTQEKYFS